MLRPRVIGIYKLWVLQYPNGSWGMVKACLYPHFDAFLARGCGRQNRAWGGASAEPQVYGVSTHQARGAGGSFLSCAISSSLRLGQWLSPAPRACAINPDRTWGSAALHPRLYAAARIRGLRYNKRALCKNVGNVHYFFSQASEITASTSTGTRGKNSLAPSIIFRMAICLTSSAIDSSHSTTISSWIELTICASRLSSARSSRVIARLKMSDAEP